MFDGLSGLAIGAVEQLIDGCNAGSLALGFCGEPGEFFDSSRGVPPCKFGDLSRGFIRRTLPPSASTFAGP